MSVLYKDGPENSGSPGHRKTPKNKNHTKNLKFEEAGITLWL